MKKKTHVIIQARMGSTRLPGKVGKELAGKPVLWHDITRCQAATSVDEVLLATTTNPADDMLESMAASLGIKCFRGSEEDVLSRFAGAVSAFESDVVVRVTSDCPLVDPRIIDLVVEGLRGYDYSANVLERNFPRGLDVEAFTASALQQAHEQATSRSDREHVTPYLRNSANGFRTKSIVLPEEYHYPQFRLTLDTPEDYEFLCAIYNHFYQDGALIDVREVLQWLSTHPEVASLNADVQQKPDPHN